MRSTTIRFTIVRPHRRAALVAAVAAALLAACDKPAAPPVAPSTTATAAPPVTGAPVAAVARHGESGIAWREAATDAEVDAAFAAARAERKPVFVYWGAKWCPPCNQVKATLFNRQDFIERSRAFVPVYVDGDSPGAQKIGARFHVRGYPTMVLFNADGKEVTRLPGEVEPARYTEVLTLGMNAARPVRDVLADALAHPATLGPNDWRLLAFYSWDTDEQQLVPKDRVAATMRALADACPADADGTAMRLRLKALAAADDAKKPPKVDPATRAAVIAMLGDEARTRAQTDMVTDYAAEIVRAMSARGSRRTRGAARRLRRRAEAPRGRPGAVARGPDAGADRAGRSRAHRRARARSKVGRRQATRRGCRRRSSPTCARRSRAPTARSPTATSARR